jgi:hypothetical protein
MSLYVLDTDIMTLYQHAHPRVVQQVLAHTMAQLSIAVISIEEELTGWYTKLRQVRKRDQLARVYQRLSEAVPFSRVFKSCRSQSQPFPAMRACASLIAVSAKTICALQPSHLNTAQSW